MSRPVCVVLIVWAVVLTAGGAADGGIRVVRRIDLSKYDQPFAQMSPGDLDGDGEVDFLFTCGTRAARAIRSDGALLWEITNPDGIVNSEPWHPWTAAVWDIDGDGANEAIIFRQQGKDPKPYLAIVDGRSGKIKAERQLWFEATTRGYKRRGLLAIAWMRRPDTPDIVVGSDDTLDDVAAFDSRLNQLWYRQFRSGEKPDYAGHYIWPYDMNADGLHELFVGKRLLDGEGNELWWMKDLGSDHVDSLAVGDIDPDIPGREVVVCGASGMRLYTSTGTLLWKVAGDVVRDPQRLALGDFRRESRGLEIVVAERFSVDKPRTVVLDRKGRMIELKTPLPHSSRMQIDWDGDRSQDEFLGQEGVSGAVETGEGESLVPRHWFLRPDDRYDWRQWWAYPLALDVEGDTREEIIAWGSRELVIGANDAPNPDRGPSFRADREYRLRYANLYMNRSPVYFEFRRPEAGAR